MQSVTNIEIITLLNKIFEKSMNLLALLAPNGWRLSEYVNFFHPTPDQQFEEDKALAKQLNTIRINKNLIESYSLNQYQQDDLNNISEAQEFQYVLWLSVYDIFSNNNKVFNKIKEEYNLGSFRGSGRFLANFLNDKNLFIKKYDYIDFYMGTIWIKDRANLLPFYEYIFEILKIQECDWYYCFPKWYLIDLSSKQTYGEEDPITYKPEEAMANELEILNKEKELENFQYQLDSSFQNEYEEAKYKPLIPIVQAYKNIYNRLPDDHPQREIE